MIVNNLSNKILLLFNEQNYDGASYVVKELFFNRCASSKVVASGNVVDNQISLQLKDGQYIIELSKVNMPDVEESFTVYYNNLPGVINKLQEIICPCDGCGQKNKDALRDNLLFLLGYLQSIGKLCGNTLFNFNLNKMYKKLSEAEEYNKYYGTFTFDYEKAYEELFVSAYLELYYESTNQIVDTDKELDLINSIFRIDEIENCIYRKGYDVNEILCQVTNLKCDCNEL